MTTQDFRIPNRATGVGIANTNISFADIQTEFGGANPIGLTEYYSGGPYVPTGVSGYRGNVPSSGAISALDLARVDLVGIFTRKWTSSASLDTPVGAINDNGLFFFSSTMYDTSLQAWMMPTAVFDRDGQELWSIKTNLSGGGAGTTKYIHTTSFSTSSNNFVVGGYDEKANTSDRARAYLLEYDAGFTDVLHRRIQHNTLSFNNVHWTKDKNNDDVYMIATHDASVNELIIVKFNGPISSITSSSSIAWARRYPYKNITGSVFYPIQITKISSFIHEPVRNRIYVSMIANNNPISTGALNKTSVLVMGINAGTGVIEKYGFEYRGGTYPSTTSTTIDYYEMVLTTSDSEGAVYGSQVEYFNNVDFYTEASYHCKFMMNGSGDPNSTVRDGYEMSAGWVDDTTSYAQTSGPFWSPEPNTWDTFRIPKAAFIVDENSPIRFTDVIYREPGDNGQVLNLFSQLLQPENETLPVTGGRIIVADLNAKNTTVGDGSGLASWYARDNTYTETNMFLDLYNYCSAFQQRTNKKRIGLAATSKTKTGTKNDLILTIMPTLTEIDYYLTNVWYQKVGDPPRWPDPQARYGDQIYGNVTYKTISNYMYDSAIVLYTPSGLTQREVEPVYMDPNEFSVTPRTWLGWSTSQGNPITKTASYPNTTYTTAPSSSTSEYYTITTNQQELNLRNWLLAQGWNGVNPVYVTVNSGVYIWSDNTSVPALTIDGNFPNGLVIENYGYIMGRGGNAGNAGNAVPSLQNVAGQNGGPAILTSVELNINSSNGYIGGGGGGGASYINDVNGYTVGGGGGQGGGIGGVGYFSGNFAQGGAGGSIGNSGANGTAVSGPDFNIFGGGGGGRVFPGVGAPAVTNQQGGGIGGTGGGSGACSLAFNVTPKSSGAGGSAGVAGGSPLVYKNVYPHGGAGGGGFGAAGGGISFNNSETPASSGGPSIQTINGVTVTWIGGFPTNRVFGAVV
jgi:hypothetical protein